ncbi:MAG: hypothetical protein PVG39_31510 [Desulfobacteraceae bacterium]|jgi:hypothetical protein
MTPSEVKQYILDKEFKIGSKLVMFLKVLYPDLKKQSRYIKRGGQFGFEFPSGCKLFRNRNGHWILESYTSDDIDELCEGLSTMKSLDIDVPIYHQNAHDPDNTLVWVHY